MGMAILLIVIVVIVGIWMSVKNDNESRKANALALTTIPGFVPAVQYDGAHKKCGVAIDPQSEQFAITSPSGPRVFRFSDLVSVEVMRDGQSLTKSNRGSQAVGAAVGAVLLGPIGLLMGGLTGSRREEQKVKRLSLKIYTNDLVSPVYEICFLDMPSPIKNDGILATMAGKLLDEWFGRFQTILHNQPQRVST